VLFAALNQGVRAAAAPLVGQEGSVATARQLGLSFSHLQPQPPSRSTADGGGTSAMPNAPAPAAAPVFGGPNARERRSAARSAQRHMRRAQM
jgi:hypothetical protein